MFRFNFHNFRTDKIRDKMKEVIYTQKAPEPVGPYSQAIDTGNLLFISGQIPLNPQEGKLVEGHIGEKTEQVMQNIKVILNEAGLNFDHVVKASLFIKDMSCFAEINKVYASFFTANPPAREVAAVTTLPLNSEIMISMIACR